MKKGAVITIVNACIWGLVLIATALALKGTDSFEKIQHILGGGAGTSLLVVSSSLRRNSKK